MGEVDESIQMQHGGTHHGVQFAAGEVRMVWTHCWVRAPWGGWLQPVLNGKRRFTAYRSSKEQRLKPTSVMDKFPKPISYLYLCNSGHVLLIYFEGSSVQFLNQDCGLKISKEDGDIYRGTKFRSLHYFFWLYFTVITVFSEVILILYSWCLDY